MPGGGRQVDGRSEATGPSTDRAGVDDLVVARAELTSEDIVGRTVRAEEGDAPREEVILSAKSCSLPICSRALGQSEKVCARASSGAFPRFEVSVLRTTAACGGETSSVRVTLRFLPRQEKEKGRAERGNESQIRDLAEGAPASQGGDRCPPGLCNRVLRAKRADAPTQQYERLPRRYQIFGTGVVTKYCPFSTRD